MCVSEVCEEGKKGGIAPLFSLSGLLKKRNKKDSLASEEVVAMESRAGVLEL